MPKRVSLKGKGADIFFGDYEVPDRSPAVMPAEDNQAPAEPAQPTPSRNSPRKKASMQESKHARKQAAIVPAPPSAGPLPSEAITGVWQQVCERATVTNAFRYTDQELSRLTDALYELTKRHSVKLTKQDVARLGLDLVLWDYQTRGDASLLGEFALRKKRQNGEGI